MKKSLKDASLASLGLVQLSTSISEFENNLTGYRRIDGRTDGRTDTYRDARTHLEKTNGIFLRLHRMAEDMFSPFFSP